MSVPSPSALSTFATVLARRTARDPGRPLLTFYDLSSGERTELSVTTYANWVAKAASLLVEEADLERGQRIVLDLPPHWLGPVFLGAAWSVGLSVVAPEVTDADAVVCGPAGLATWAPVAGSRPVFACALAPLGVRFATPLPPGVRDVGVEIWSQPDAFTAWQPPRATDVAHVLGGAPVLQSELWAALGSGPGARLLTSRNPVADDGLAAFTRTLAGDGSLVIALGADDARLDKIASDEQVTARFEV